MPVFAGIGLALGASAATATATGVAVVSTAATIGATAYSTIQQKRAADAAARTSEDVAQYNAKLDRADATQIELDTQANIAALRRDASTYMSRQTTAYVAAGVRADTGSPLVARAVTAGRYEMKAQQMWADANARAERLESQAQAGIRQGEAQADQFHLQGVAAVMSGASRVAGQLYGAYRGGDFAGTGTNDLSAGLREPPPPRSYSTGGP